MRRLFLLIGILYAQDDAAESEEEGGVTLDTSLFPYLFQDSLSGTMFMSFLAGNQNMNNFLLYQMVQAWIGIFDAFFYLHTVGLSR